MSNKLDLLELTDISFLLGRLSIATRKDKYVHGLVQELIEAFDVATGFKEVKEDHAEMEAYEER
jgi:hypothetical protein